MPTDDLIHDLWGNPDNLTEDERHAYEEWLLAYEADEQALQEHLKHYLNDNPDPQAGVLSEGHRRLRYELRVAG